MRIITVLWIIFNIFDIFDIFISTSSPLLLFTHHPSLFSFLPPLPSTAILCHLLCVYTI
ncbi:hypothetical protein M430DRAFT_253396 [Amorphotheca resinae ATCC 22711]|uniref:Uncharacterized protein n=1 Tax=Amorphotheca resinae ATCC 22711 TaxID=857342 RepID=A0A2T3AXN5_AMORE|nr:hypothetical protein M430DRAFT_253396 [Amorphotheca resinae ATCC 22711]PSS14839.1 hypothetical protein M430DRAFT_253396 [Amorphotheca resinae ATCC 22711]